MSKLQVLRARLHTDSVLGWLAVLLAVSIPISVFADNLLLALMLLIALPLYGDKVMAEIRDDRAVRVGFPLFLLLLLLVGYGNGSMSYSFGVLAKYMDIVLIPVFVVAMRLPNVRQRAELAFLGCSAIILVLSYLLKFGVLHQQPWMWFGAEEYGGSIFRHYLVQNFLMAYAVFLAMLKARHATSKNARLAWSIFVLVGLVNIFGVVIGRTGQIVMIVLSLWFVVTSERFTRLDSRLKVWVSVLIGCAVVSFPLMVDQFATNSAFDKRFKLAVGEASTWQPGVADESSVGARLGFYYRCIELIRERPVLGYGTGGFPEAYASKGYVSNIDQNLQNPHNQYLLISVQAGTIGLIALLVLFGMAWKNCCSLSSAFDRRAGQGLILAIMVDGLFNSPLLDHTDGLFFAYMYALWISGERYRENHA